VYAPFVYDGQEHHSAACVEQLVDRSVVVGSFSKSHAVSGWRLGFLRAVPRLTAVLRQVHSVTTAGATAPLQRAAAVSLRYGDALRHSAAQMQQRRDLAVTMVQDAGMTCVPPAGGCYVLADITSVTSLDCTAFARELADEAGVLVAPATDFFAVPDSGSSHVRIAFNRPTETLQAARDRIVAHLAERRVPSRRRPAESS
jgi:N-succinyldiaminopimelate aminotransferase